LKTTFIGIDKIGAYEDALNLHLSSVFEEPVNVEINEEFCCAVVIEDENKIVACGLGYSRKMLQGNIEFNAGIIGGLAVNIAYRGVGLCKKVMQQLDNYMVSNEFLYTFLLAYDSEIYLSSGYSNLLAPIHYFDIQTQIWNTFIYRGGMVKSYGLAQLHETQVVEFKGCVY